MAIPTPGVNISDDQLDALRGLVGTEPDDSDLEDRFFRLGDIYLVAIEWFTEQRAELLNDPAQFSVPGYSENNSANLAAMDKQITALQATADRLGVSIGSGLTSVPLTRVMSRR